MAKEVYVLERLVVSVGGYRRSPTEPGVERLIVDLTFKNPTGLPQATQRPPAMEVRDSMGRVYAVDNTDWAEPILPDTEFVTRAEVDIADDADRRACPSS